MEIIKNKFINNFFFFIILLLPVIYISGSLLLNFSILLIIIFSSFFLTKNSIKIFFNKYKYFLIFFLTIVILNTFSSETKLFSISKLGAYLRFLIFPISYIYLILRLSKVDLKKISKFYFLIILFVIVDSLIQLIFGKDIFGFSYYHLYNRITGPFGDEMIVGFYLLNFGILTISFLNYFDLIKKNTNFYLFLFLALTILLTGERSAYLSFFYFLFFLFIFSKNKKIIFFTSISIVIASIILISNLNFLKNKYPIQQIIQSKILVENKNSIISSDNLEDSSLDSINLKNINNNIPIYKWLGHFERAIEIIEKNLFFGSGFRNYRIICFEYQIKFFERKNISKCSTHPHNFHLEILSDNGIVGYLAFIIFVFYLFTTFIKGKLNNNFGITIIFCLILAFIFPFKPTGSIFTTNYAFVFWYLVGNYFFLIRNIKNLN